MAALEISSVGARRFRALSAAWQRGDVTGCCECPDAATFRVGSGWGHRSMEQRVFTVAGRNVSVALEEQFWDCLENIAVERDVSLQSLVHQVGRLHPLDVPSALRLHVLEDVLQKTGIELTAGHNACERMLKYH